MTEPTRPALRWMGGKWRLAPQLIALMPPHRIYVEPFGGAASVLIRKPRAYAEILCEMDGRITTYFRVLRDPATAAELERRLRLTPFSRAEFLETYEPDATTDPIEIARRLVVRSLMGHGASAANSEHVTGFRSNSNRSHTTPAHDWASFPDALPALTARLQGVVIENRDALTVMRRQDGPDTLHVVDPPYLQATRSRGNPHCAKHLYRHELDAADHEALLEAVQGLAGMVMISGYASDLYDRTLVGWERVELAAYADGARKRTEVVWLNPAAVERRDRDMREFGLFAREAAE